MGTGGGLFDGGDVIGAARLNQKSTFVGTGGDINTLATTYAGMSAYCTSTGSGFTVDHLYIRNTANAAWIDVVNCAVSVSETAEANQNQAGDTAETTAVAGRRYYAFFTVPSSENYYLITKIEWKNGATVAGNVLCGVDVVNANPPTIGHCGTIAWGRPVVQTPISSLQSTSDISSAFIRKGTIIGVWIKFTSASATFRQLTGAGSQNQQRADPNTNFTQMDEDVAWSTATTRQYITVYYRGYI